MFLSTDSKSVAATASVVVPTSADTDQKMSGQPKKLSGKYFSVFVAFTVISVPMVVLPALLLWLVLNYSLTQVATPPDLRTPADIEQSTTSAYYVNFSSTTLVFLASLMSILSSSLVSSLMVLYSYPIMSRIVRKSENSRNADLPTPFQLNLLIQLVKGGLGPVWAWVQYIFGWKGKRAKITKEVSCTGGFLVAAIGLSLLLSVANTWLHLTTKSVQFSQLIVNGQPRQAYGRGLSAGCAEWYVNFPDSRSCTAGGGRLLNEQEVFNTLYNVSANNRIISYSESGQVYALVADPSPRGDADFTASTFAVATKCEVITQDCNVTHPWSQSLPFNCHKINFSGDLGDNPLNFNFYNGSDGRYNETVLAGINPFYWALASLSPSFNVGADNPDMKSTYKGLATVMWCNTTVYDVTYSQVNGSVANLVVSPSNHTVGGIFSQPLDMSPGYWEPVLMNTMREAALSNTSQQLINIFAPVFSRTAAVFASGGMSPRDNIEEQTRNSLIAARVPKAPLYTIVILGLLYALLGVALTVIALCITGEGLHETVAKMSIEGLVAERFEQPRLGKPVEEIKEQFEEVDGKGSSRVGVHKGELGGWVFTTTSRIV